MSRSYEYPLGVVEEYLNKTPFRLDGKKLYILNFTGDELIDHSLLKNKAEEKGYELSLIEFQTVEESFLGVVEYYLPFLASLESPSFPPDYSVIFGDIKKDYNAPVKFLFYSDFHNLYVNIIESPQDIIEFLAQLPQYANRNLSDGEILFSPQVSYEDPVPLNEETQNIINDIKDKLQNLNDTGQFLTILPIIEKELQNYKSRMNFPVSNLHIDDQYRIFLTDYNNKEVKLSHLSKSIYFLFLMKEKIHLNDFGDYKSELLTIYKHVSNQENFEKMESTIDNLVLNENKELYVHFSRIKSAFCSVIADDFAKNYYIKGDKNKPKQVVLDHSKSNIKELQSEFFPDENIVSVRKYFDGLF